MNANTTTAPALISFVAEIQESIYDRELYFGDQESESNYFYFEENNLFVEGTILATGYYRESGDGYWTPRETYLAKAEVEILIDSACYDDDENGICRQYTRDEIAELERKLQEYLDKHPFY